MADLTKDTPIRRGVSNLEVIEKLTAEGETFVGATLVEGTAACGVVEHAAETTGFAGLALGHADESGEDIDVLRVGLVVTSLNATVAQSNVGDTVYAPASSDNPADWNLTSASNMPVGKIVTVKTAGAAGVNEVLVLIQADGYRSI